MLKKNNAYLRMVQVIPYVMFVSGDYGSVFSLVTNTELQPVETLMSHALVRCSFDYLWIDNKG